MLFTRRKNISYQAAGLADRGLVRENNEDRFFVLDESATNALGAGTYGIYIIADGMGGHQAGEVASELAVRVISTALQENLKGAPEPPSPERIIEQAIEKANDEIYHKASSKPDLHAMGTTVTLGLRLDNQLYLGHVGDSRAYLYRRGRLQPLTEDHSLVARLVKDKVITDEQAKTHPDRGKILRCLGVSGKVAIDTYNYGGSEHKLILHKGDSLLFCSDGLTGYVEDREILKCLKENGNVSEVCQKLVDFAKSGGGGDNISVIVVQVK